MDATHAVALPETIAALLSGHTVRCLHLVELCFATQARRLHNGNIPKITTGGHDWFGNAKLGGIDGLATDGDLQAEELRFTVSGADARFLAVAVGPREEYINKHAKVYLQFFDSDWQLLDEPVARAAAIIDGVPISRGPMEGSGTRRTIQVTATNIFYARSVPSASYFTNSDQHRRFPGDRGLQWLAETLNRNIPFPW